ncbi:MAG: trp operon repressor [Deltaproteobacteria bacterium]|nr:trp operon repressor [Deltaproteobacteria bacterium]MBI2975289.1 trp operon repressor [Deltaproteobacteria bacterium]
MEADWKRELIDLIESSHSKGEMNELLTALLTPSEYKELAKRWQIVKKLIEGATQREIRNELKVSIATVTRGSREIQYGNGVFKKFYKRLCDRKSHQHKST